MIKIHDLISFSIKCEATFPNLNTQYCFKTDEIKSNTVNLVINLNNPLDYS